MAHEHILYDDDTSFIINPNTREIVALESLKTKLVQYDHNSEKISFVMPRYAEGHDMSLCTNIEIHYINVSADGKNQSSDVYIVDDFEISPDSDDSVIFTWLVSENATRYAGTIEFLVRFICKTEDSIDYALNTKIYKGISVADGMNNTAGNWG